MLTRLLGIGSASCVFPGVPEGWGGGVNLQARGWGGVGLRGTCSSAGPPSAVPESSADWMDHRVAHEKDVTAARCMERLMSRLRGD